MNHTSQLTHTFIDLCRIDSPTGAEKNLARHIILFLKNLNVDARLDSYGNVHAFIPGVGEPILFVTHMDVVEPCRGVQPIIKDGYIMTDGTTVLGADNKVAVAAVLECVQTLQEKKIPSRPLDLVFTCSEEVGNEGAIHFDYSLLSGRTGFSFDSGEPFGTIILGSPFYERFDITFEGVGTHASRPETGRNALLMLRDALPEIPLGRPSETSTCNIGIIEGGKARNAVPGSFTMHGEVRSFIESELRGRIEAIRTVCMRAAHTHHGKAHIETVRENGGFLFSESHPAVLQATKALAIVGARASYKKVLGCFDANIFAEHKIDIINIAHGAENSHGTTERMSIANLTQLGELVLQLATMK